ncbi:hypothetical protein [uncultured Bacteroides sp.]|uniref:hypothetical protein n=1 Tax=uncultured Bacteroides sp. TaxID=162156 RepID=UPI0025967134|nr:hypothetical protein [uncultured Bacteroides sp.]
MQVFPGDIVHYPEFLRSPAVAQVKFFSSGMVAVQMLARGFEDIEKGDIGRITRWNVRLYITGIPLAGEFDESGT